MPRTWRGRLAMMSFQWVGVDKSALMTGEGVSASKTRSRF